MIIFTKMLKGYKIDYNSDNFYSDYSDLKSIIKCDYNSHKKLMMANALTSIFMCSRNISFSLQAQS